MTEAEDRKSDIREIMEAFQRPLMASNNERRQEIEDHEKRIRTLETENTKNQKDIETIMKSLTKIDSNITWLLRLVIGFVITALLGLIVIGAQVPIK